MSMQDVAEIKEKMLLTFKSRGPCLPVEIAKETGLSILFASAFLSEFLSEKKIKISYMKVGSSPLYFLSGQEPMLAKYSNYLNSKEKDAFILLKEKKLLKDKNQEPSIRVALREIKDFAIPFRKDEEIYWRYFIFSEEEVRNLFENKKVEVVEKEETIEKKELKIEKQVENKKIPKKKISKRKPRENKKNEKFFEEVKQFLRENNLELEDIIGVGKKELILLVKIRENKKILIAYDKKRIDEKDISKASNKAKEYDYPYILLSKGGPLKKIRDLIENLENMSSLESL